MRQQVPWIGYQNHLQYHRNMLAASGVMLRTFHDPRQGLEEIMDEEQRMILISGSIPLLSKEYNPNPHIYEGTCSAISQLRKSKNQQTPILVVSGNQQQPYLDSGATGVIDASALCLVDFAKQVMSYLGKR